MTLDDDRVERRAREADRVARRHAAIAARPSMSPTGPAHDRLRLATWNLNSLRVRTPAVERFLARTSPDVVCLQETKAAAVSHDAHRMFDRHGYDIEHVGANAYNGVAIAARHPIRAVQHSGQFGDAALDREPRLITAQVDAAIPLRVASVYVPHGRTLDHWHYDFKLEFLQALAGLAAAWVRDGHLLVAGDLNVAATDSDVFHPDAFIGATHVSPPERAALADLYDVGLVDADVAVWGARARRFTWWNHGIGYSRNLGMRIDHLAVDDELASRIDTTWIDHHERGAERPSDHAALVADFDLDPRGASTALEPGPSQGEQQHQTDDDEHDERPDTELDSVRLALEGLGPARLEDIEPI
jgi:exodeoxyribonuclease-3